MYLFKLSLILPDLSFQKAFIFRMLLNINLLTYLEVVKPVLRGHFWDKEKVVLSDRRPLKRGSIHM
jgi:hypothetical protein